MVPALTGINGEENTGLSSRPASTRSACATPRRCIGGLQVAVVEQGDLHRGIHRQLPAAADGARPPERGGPVRCPAFHAMFFSKRWPTASRTSGKAGVLLRTLAQPASASSARAAAARERSMMMLMAALRRGWVGRRGRWTVRVLLGCGRRTTCSWPACRTAGCIRCQRAHSGLAGMILRVLRRRCGGAGGQNKACRRNPRGALGEIHLVPL